MPDVELVGGFVQDAPLERFDALESGDVVFIDSSHALRIERRDVLVLEVLSQLNPGVFVHIHDVYFPFTDRFSPQTPGCTESCGPLLERGDGGSDFWPSTLRSSYQLSVP